MLTSSNIRRMLERKYCQPEWALFHEVADATGVGRRRADAVAVNLWASRGLTIHGFEIKVSRSDWIRELRAPDKAEAVMRNCDHWWVVAPSGVVLAGELPPTWGHYLVDGRGVVCSVKAPKLPNDHIEGVRPFLASLIRRAGQMDDAERQRLVREETVKIRESAKAEAEREADRRSAEYRRLKEQVDAFEKVSGIRITEYVGGTELGRAVALVQRIGSDHTYRTVTGLHNSIKDMAETLGKALAVFREGEG
jgi:hypothetical protein